MSSTEKSRDPDKFLHYPESNPFSEDRQKHLDNLIQDFLHTAYEFANGASVEEARKIKKKTSRPMSIASESPTKVACAFQDEEAVQDRSEEHQEEEEEEEFVSQYSWIDKGKGREIYPPQVGASADDAISLISGSNGSADAGGPEYYEDAEMVDEDADAEGYEDADAEGYEDEGQEIDALYDEVDMAVEENEDNVEVDEYIAEDAMDEEPDQEDHDTEYGAYDLEEAFKQVEYEGQNIYQDFEEGEEEGYRLDEEEGERYQLDEEEGEQEDGIMFFAGANSLGEFVVEPKLLNTHLPSPDQDDVIEISDDEDT
ncbi:hypothetical protein M422DRAFT_776572 [Sphaerobolus stellatus SS14]|nr:hypothetical protein M422DRAFT_776572 [Sphaerobolus stellatus SS14]